MLLVWLISFTEHPENTIHECVRGNTRVESRMKQLPRFIYDFGSRLRQRAHVRAGRCNSRKRQRRWCAVRYPCYTRGTCAWHVSRTDVNTVVNARAIYHTDVVRLN